jgi:hypothetical protein
VTTIGLQEAARLLRMSEDALMRKARAGIVPGDKPGREWVFIREDLLAWLRERMKARACRSTAILRARSGGSDSQLAASRLDARLKQLTATPQTNSKRAFALISGGRSSSASDPGTPGEKPSSDGAGNASRVTSNANRSG